MTATATSRAAYHSNRQDGTQKQRILNALGEQRPDIPPSGGAGKVRPAALRRLCEECGQELEEQRVIMRGHVVYVSSCPRCTPDALKILKE